MLKKKKRKIIVKESDPGKKFYARKEKKNKDIREINDIMPKGYRKSNGCRAV